MSSVSVVLECLTVFMRSPYFPSEGTYNNSLNILPTVGQEMWGAE